MPLPQPPVLSCIPRRERRTSFDEIAARVEKKVGKIPLSGRFHRHPEKIEDSYDLTEVVLGEGFSGAIYLAYSRGGGSAKSQSLKYAVKAFSLDGISDQERLDFKSELEIFLTIDHPHIARLVDVYENDRTLHLVMECLEGGELYDRLIEQKKFTEQDAAEAAYQMLLAVNYLHTLGIVHRDIKLENFLYDVRGSGHLKLIDFGFSKIWDPNFNMQKSCGTLAYIAPEVLQKNYTSQCDLWSVGVIVFILLAGRMPFNGSGDIQIQAICSGQYDMRPARWHHVSDEGRNFTACLLQVHAENRLTATQAIEHPWINRIVRFRRRTYPVDESIVTSLREFGKASKFRRACMSMIAWSLTNEERAEVRKDFLEIDKSKEGTITFDELRQVLSEKFAVHDSEVRLIFDTLDSNKDERIRYSDFLAAMVSTRIELHDDLIRAAFDRFDTDHSGYITPDNIRQMLGDYFDGADAHQLISEADFKNDGRISYSEFVAYLKGEKWSDAHDASHQSLASRFIDCEVERHRAFERTSEIAFERWEVIRDSRRSLSHGSTFLSPPVLESDSPFPLSCKSRIFSQDILTPCWLNAGVSEPCWA